MRRLGNSKKIDYKHGGAADEKDAGRDTPREHPMKSRARRKASPQKQTTAGSVEKRDRIQGCQYASSKAI